MFRAIICDDNERHLNQINNIIEWNEYDVEIVGNFENGQEVLDNIEILMPDFIISDILMPVINGLELGKRLKNEYPKIKVVFVSSSDDFETAKSAINLNVSGYILKPIDKDDVESVIVKLVDELKEEINKTKEINGLEELVNSSKNLFKEQFFRELINGNYHTEIDSERIKFLNLEGIINKQITVIFIKIIDYEKFSANKSSENIYYISIIVNEILKKQVFTDLVIFPLQITPLDYAVIIFTDKMLKEKSKIIISDYAVRIYNDLYNDYNLGIIIGISSQKNKLLDVHELYKQANETIESRFHTKGIPIINYNEINFNGVDILESNVVFNDLYKEVKDIVFSDEEVNVKKFIAKYLINKKIKSSEIKEYSKSFVTFVISILHIILIEEHKTIEEIFGEEMILWKKMSNFESIFDVNQWLYNIFISFIHFFSSNNNSSNTILAKKIKDLIHKHYKEELNVNDIANSVFFSSRQANYLFKKETGISIFDYLVEYRIKVAKDLLLNTNMKVHEVAEEVGYSNISHFRLMFLKYTGMKPMDYKKQKIVIH